MTGCGKAKEVLICFMVSHRSDACLQESFVNCKEVSASFKPYFLNVLSVTALRRVAQSYNLLITLVME